MSLWQSPAPLHNLQRRAEILTRIRAFFAERAVMEVDTGVLSQYAVSDPYIDSLEVAFRGHPTGQSELCYLQTSPEYAMKRLLAGGCGAIYQLGKVFRNGEEGRWHNPEFTMLEWYRPGFDEQQLMQEVEALVCAVLGLASIRRVSYRALFLEQLGLDIDVASNAELAARMRAEIEVELEDDDRDGWLNLLMSHLIEPALVEDAVFVTDYPASQSALARLKEDADGRQVAARFELFVGGMELANGYHELTDAREQARRLEADNQQRRVLGLPRRPLDYRLVAALEAGLPDCAGVALGVDRLVMLAASASHIDQVMPFTFRNA